jgi:hypothetical protein
MRLIHRGEKPKMRISTDLTYDDSQVEYRGLVNSNRSVSLKPSGRRESDAREADWILAHMENAA